VGLKARKLGPSKPPLPEVTNSVTRAPVVPLYSSTLLLEALLTKRLPLGPNTRSWGPNKPPLPEVTKAVTQCIPIEFDDQPELRDELLAAIENVNRNLDRTVPAAMILEARGAVNLRSARGGAARPVRQTLLFPDDRLTLAADAHVQIVFMSDLHMERLEPGREATIGRTGCLARCGAGALRQRTDDVRTSAEGDLLHGLGREAGFGERDGD
jgi:hypothetical protein